MTQANVQAVFPGVLAHHSPGEAALGLRGGVTMRILPDASIEFDEGVFRAAYHRAPKPGEAPLGSYGRIGRDAIIRLTLAGDSTETLRHEAFHAAMDLVLTSTERRAVLARYGSEEAAAEAYAHWRPSGEPHGVFERIRTFFALLAAQLGLAPTLEVQADGVFREVDSGRVWHRAPHPEGERALHLRYRSGEQPGTARGPRPGEVVGAERWPFVHAHPDAWGRPWSGIVLAQDDPRAWHDTVAFPDRDGSLPAAEAVKTHVARCHRQGLLLDAVPVLWEFGRIYWERFARLRPYSDDQAAWLAARAQAQAAERTLKPAPSMAALAAPQPALQIER